MRHRALFKSSQRAGNHGGALRSGTVLPISDLRSTVLYVSYDFGQVNGSHH